MIGEPQYAYPQMGEKLAEAGLRYDIGYHEMVRANPQINPRAQLSPQTRLLIPSQFVLPPGPHRGVIINLAKYRLYYFPDNDNVVLT